MADALTFLGIVVVLTVTPGVDMALVMRTVLRDGMHAVWPTLGGVFSGMAVHVTLCVLGLSVVLRESDTAFASVKYAGAAWLAWLGVSSILAARRASPRVQVAAAADVDVDAPLPVARPVVTGWRRHYVRGLLTNLLNVKIALFYVAFLPQFAPSGESFAPVALALAAVQASIGFAWLASYGLLVERTGQALRDLPRVRRVFERATGVALLGFGIRLAMLAG